MECELPLQSEIDHINFIFSDVEMEKHRAEVDGLFEKSGNSEQLEEQLSLFDIG